MGEGLNGCEIVLVGTMGNEIFLLGESIFRLLFAGAIDRGSLGRIAYSGYAIPLIWRYDCSYHLREGGCAALRA